MNSQSVALMCTYDAFGDVEMQDYAKNIFTGNFLPTYCYYYGEGTLIQSRLVWQPLFRYRFRAILPRI